MLSHDVIEAVAKKLFLAEARKDADPFFAEVVWNNEPATRERFCRYAEVAINAYQKEMLYETRN